MADGFPASAVSADRRLRVLVMSSGLAGRFGGTAFSEATLCAALKEFCDVTVLCPARGYDEPFANSFGLSDIRRFSRRDILQAFWNPRHSFHKNLENIDVVHMNGHWAYEQYFLAKLCRRKKIPYVLHPRGMMLVGFGRVWAKVIFNFLIGRKIVKGAAGIIALSEFETKQFTSYSLKQALLSVIPNGILEPKVDSHTRVNTGITHPYFLYLGRIEERKNLIFLIDAFHHYCQKGGKAKLGLMGPAEEHYEKTIKERIAKLEIGERVKFLAPLYGNEKWTTVKNAMAVLYPTKEEAFGRVPFEAISVGTLVVVPDKSGSAEYLSPFLPGCIYRDDNMPSLVDTLYRIADSERDSMLDGLEKARAWVRSELNPKKTAELTFQHYLKVISPSSR